MQNFRKISRKIPAVNSTINHLCNYGLEIKSSSYSFHQCPSYINERRTLKSNLNRINPQISQNSLQLLTNTLCFGDSSNNDETNTHILNTTIDYIRLTKKFDEPLFWIMCFFSFFSYISDKFTNLYAYKFLHNLF